MTGGATGEWLPDGPVVVKIGGGVVRSPDAVDRLARELATLHAVGIPLVLVHGGGPQATQLSGRLGIPVTVIDGRRVTDAAALEVVKMVFAGQLNTDLVAALLRHGVRPVGLSGIAGGILRAHRRPPVRWGSGAEARDVDFGFVGDLDAVSPQLMLELVRGGYLPVLCSLAADEAGSVLNVNADTVAAAIAVALRARRLIVFTEVPGVYRDFASRTGLIGCLDVVAARRLVEDRKAASGMAPKLTACVVAVEGGVPEARIAGGPDPVALRNAATGLPGAGTRIVTTCTGGGVAG